MDPQREARARSRDGTPPSTNFPVVRDRLIGRESLLISARQLLLRDDVGLLTLTGPGGTGKTRLALQLASDVLRQFDDGACFVPLASVADSGLVASTIVLALGIHDGGDRSPDERLLSYLRDRRLLLLLDNFEHLGPAAPLVADLLVACPGLKVLATSRAVLRVRGEYDFPVPPLLLPSPDYSETAAEAEQSPAVRLFVERARAARADFALTDANVAAVVKICRRLDGLPLAIELAAARLRHLTPLVLLARLEPRLPLLTGGALGAPARQQTLRDAIGWSYDLLGEDERWLFQRLAVFVGGCTLEAAEAVCGTDGNEATDVLDTIASLVDKSLLSQQDVLGVPRFSMLETIREYALERLAESGEGEAVRRHFAGYFLELGEHADVKLQGAEQRAWLGRLEADHDNFRAALTWSLADASRAESGLRVAGALGRFWNIRGHYSEGSRWLRQTLAACGTTAPPAVRAYALLRAGSLAHWAGDTEGAEELLREGLELYQALGDEVGMARALSTLGLVAVSQSDPMRAIALAEQSVSRARAAGDDYGTGYSLVNLARARLGLGDLAGARRDIEEGVALCRAASDDWAVAVGLSRLGVIAYRQRDVDRADAASRESLGVCREVGDPRIASVALLTVGRVARATGALATAATLFGAVARLRGAAGAPLYPEERADFDHDVDALRRLLGRTAFDAAWSEGRAMSAEQAIERALRGASPAGVDTASGGKRAKKQGDRLTRREREVAIMVGRGYTNRQIAKHLVIAEKTAEVHARNIREKLGLSTRAGLAAWVAQQGLLPADA